MVCRTAGGECMNKEAARVGRRPSTRTMHGHRCRVADVHVVIRDGVGAQRAQGRVSSCAARWHAGQSVIPLAQANPYDHLPFSSKSPFSAATPVTTYTSAIDAYDTWVDQQRVHTAGERAGGKWSPNCQRAPARTP